MKYSALTLLVALAGFGCSDDESSCNPACGLGYSCNESTGACEATAGGCAATGCAAPKVCNQTTGNCEDPGTKTCPPCDDDKVCNKTTGQCEARPDVCNPKCDPGQRCDLATKQCVDEAKERCATFRDCIRRAGHSLDPGTCDDDIKDPQAKNALVTLIKCQDNAKSSTACSPFCAAGGTLQRMQCSTCVTNACHSEALACQTQGCTTGCNEPDMQATYDIKLLYAITNGCAFETCDVFVNLSVGNETAKSETVESDSPTWDTKLLSIQGMSLTKLTVEIVNWDIMFNDTIGSCSFAVTAPVLSVGRVAGQCGDVKEIAFDILPQ